MDCLLDGRLSVIQSTRGYRFSVDPLLLSEFVTTRPGDVVVDLGTGCGIILLILLYTRNINRAFGLEIQEELAGQAARNAAINRFKDRMHVIMGDLRQIKMKKGWADVVVCNPPYRPRMSGRINPDLRRAIARHEMMASLEDILRASAHLLGKKGRVALIYSASRLGDLLSTMKRHNLEPKRLQLIHPSSFSDAKLAMVEALFAGKPGLTVMPPIISQGRFSIEGGP